MRRNSPDCAAPGNSRNQYQVARLPSAKTATSCDEGLTGGIMPSWIPAWAAELLREHWRFLLISWLGINAIQTMPSPAEKGPTSSALYKWLFGFMHLSAAAVPRVIYTLFPQ